MPAQPTTRSHIAVLLLDAETMRILWCNDEYAEHMAQRPASELVGEPYEQAVAVLAPVKAPVYHRIAETGVPESGTDYFVDFDNGSTARHWQIHLATPNLLIAIIHWL